MRHKTGPEESEDRPRRPADRHDREDEGERRAEHPVREAAPALSLRAEPLREDLRDEHPDDHALTHGEEDDEEEVEYDYSYSGLTDEEYRMYVLAVYLESGNQSYECKEAVASVIMNRVNLEEFPDTVYSVLTQDGQFTIDFSCTDVPDSDCYLAVDNVLNYGSVLPSGVKYFFADYCTDSWLWSREVYTTIDNVVFAY